AMKDQQAEVLTAHLAVDPSTVVAKLRPYLAIMFEGRGLNEGPPWPLDFMAVDIDGCDCLVTEELMQLVRPKVLQLEIAYHIPPPFRFTSQWDASRSNQWQ
ncbi:unnamed protein product, partial [Polarella glacialis]